MNTVYYYIKQLYHQQSQTVCTWDITATSTAKVGAGVSVATLQLSYRVVRRRLRLRDVCRHVKARKKAGRILSPSARCR